MDEFFFLLCLATFRRAKRNCDTKVHGFRPFHFLSSLTDSGHQEAFSQCSEWEAFAENDKVMTVQHGIEITR